MRVGRAKVVVRGTTSTGPVVSVPEALARLLARHGKHGPTDARGFTRRMDVAQRTLEPGARVHPDADLAPDVFVAAGVEVPAGVRVTRTALLTGARIEPAETVAEEIRWHGQRLSAPGFSGP